MTQSIIDIGDAPNDGTGDPVRDAFNKCNNNFTELYAADAAGGGTPVPPQGRLTLQTGTPVMTTTNSAKTTIFYSPYCGDKVPIYNGVFTMTTFTELSVLTTNATKNPAAVGASQVLDWFIWDDAGTLRISHGPAWTNDTTRSAGTALVRVGGLWLNNAAITNACAAQRGTYVGTTRSNASSQLDWILGAADTASMLGVWNAYNRISVASIVTTSVSQWSYSSATVRSPNGSTFYWIGLIRGLDEDMVEIAYHGKMQLNIANGTAFVGIGLNSTTAYATGNVFNQLALWDNSALLTVPGAPALYAGYPGIGYNYWNALEASDGSNGAIFSGQSGGALIAHSVRM